MKPVIGITCRNSHDEHMQYTKLGVARAYVDSVLEAGGIPLLLPSGSGSADLAPRYLNLCQGIILSGGEDVEPGRYGEPPHPKLGKTDSVRDQDELAIVHEAKIRKMPLFGICRGLQILNVAYGGTHFQDLPSEFSAAGIHDSQSDWWESKPHSVEISVTSCLHKILGTTKLLTNSAHHQAIKTLGVGLTASAKSTPDGIIEAVEDPHSVFTVGVQWHPETLWQGEKGDVSHLALFKALVSASATSK